MQRDLLFLIICFCCRCAVICMVLRHSAGDLRIWSDCFYTVDGFRKKRWLQTACKHDLLWIEIGQLVQNRKVFVLWTKAHVLPKHIISGQVSRFNAFGNECADLLAKAGARISAIDTNQERTISFFEGRAHLIRSRLIAIQRCAILRREQNKDTCEWHDDFRKQHFGEQKNMCSVKKQIEALVQEHKDACKRMSDGSLIFPDIPPILLLSMAADLFARSVVAALRLPGRDTQQS